MENINSVLLRCRNQYAHLFDPLPQDHKIAEITRRIFLIAVPLFLALAALFHQYSGFGHRSVTPPPAPRRPPPPDEPPAIPVSTNAESQQPAPAMPTEGSIKEFYEGMFPNFNVNLRGEKGLRLRQMIAAYKEAASVSTRKSEQDPVEEIEFQLAYFSSLSPNVFCVPKMNLSGDIQAPPLGNCLFFAAGWGVQMLKPNLQARGFWPEISALNNFPLDHEAFRTEVVDWMRQHDDGTLSMYIDLAIIDTRDALIRKCSEASQSAPEVIRQAREALAQDPENPKLQSALANALKRPEEIAVEERRAQEFQGHEAYFNLLQNPDEFASRAELYAIGAMYHVQIRIEREQDGRRILFGDEILYPEYEDVITVVHKNGDHFDLRPSIQR